MRVSDNSGQLLLDTIHQAPVVQRLDNAINHYPVDSVVCFVNTSNNRGQINRYPVVKCSQNILKLINNSSS